MQTHTRTTVDSTRGHGDTVESVMTRNVQWVRPEDSAYLALQMLLWGRFHHLPVLRDENIVGMVTERSVLEAQRDVPGRQLTVAEVMERHPPTARPDEPLGAAARRMVDKHVDALPVLEGTRLAGIVTTTDVLTHEARRHARAAVRRGGPRAADLMTAAPLTAYPDEDLLVVLERMVKRRVRHLPVVDRNERLVGMLSDRDLRARLGDPIEALRTATSWTFDTETVASAMTPDPIRVSADATIDELAACLVDERVGAVPVVEEDDVLVGIVSYVDVLYHALERRERPSHGAGPRA